MNNRFKLTPVFSVDLGVLYFVTIVAVGCDIRWVFADTVFKPLNEGF